LGLIAGVYADRIRRRPIMIICDLLRMVALGSVPLAYVLGQLSMEQLYVVALLVGVGTVFFDVAYQSYLPAIISRSDLVEGNSKLQVTGSVAQMVGQRSPGFSSSSWVPLARSHSMRHRFSCRSCRCGGSAGLSPRRSPHLRRVAADSSPRCWRGSDSCSATRRYRASPAAPRRRTSAETWCAPSTSSLLAASCTCRPVSAAWSS